MDNNSDISDNPVPTTSHEDESWFPSHLVHLFRGIVTSKNFSLGNLRLFGCAQYGISVTPPLVVIKNPRGFRSEPSRKNESYHSHVPLNSEYLSDKRVTDPFYPIYKSDFF